MASSHQPCTIRPARPEEAERLSRLALRSKAHWGYSPEFLDACAGELSCSPRQIASPRFRFAVAEAETAVVGFYALELLSNDELELDALFVEPSHIGSGIGRTLMDHAKRTASELGADRLVIVSDPHADAFYRAAGGVRTGRRESGSVPGRFLPVFTVRLRGDVDGPAAGPSVAGPPVDLSRGTPGTYMLLIELAERLVVEVGRAGRMDFEPGLYAYVGSALGPGGLTARLRRHASRPARKHWHVDHLLGLSDRARLAGVLVIEGDERRECAWAAWVEGAALATVDGFGASDCRCQGHLFHISQAPGPAARNRFAEQAWRDLGARPVPVERLTA